MRLRSCGCTAPEFSSCGSARVRNVLIGTSLASGSAFKQRLAALRPGDAVTLRGPVNNFTLGRARTQVVLLAQGVGITPLRSMLAHIAQQNLAVETSLIHVARAGHAYRRATEAWAARSAYPDHADEFRALAMQASQAHRDATFYIAGAPAFVSSTAALLRDSGIARGEIRQDKYLGYRAEPRKPTETVNRALVP